FPTDALPIYCADASAVANAVLTLETTSLPLDVNNKVLIACCSSAFAPTKFFNRKSVFCPLLSNDKVVNAAILASESVIVGKLRSIAGFVSVALLLAQNNNTLSCTSGSSLRRDDASFITSEAVA